MIDRVPRLQVAGAHAKEKFRNMQIECQNYAYEHGIDKPEVDELEVAVLEAMYPQGFSWERYVAARMKLAASLRSAQGG